MAETSTTDTSPLREGKPGRRTSETMVMLAMGVVTVAFGAGLYMQVGLTLWLAFIAALSMYVALLTLHALVRRGDTVENLNAEIRRLEAEVARLSARGPAGAALANAAAAAHANHDLMAAPRPAAAAPQSAKPPMPPIDAPPAANRSFGEFVPVGATQQQPSAAVKPALEQRMEPRANANQHPWSFRPAEPPPATAQPHTAITVDPAIDRIAASFRAPTASAGPAAAPPALPVAQPTVSAVRDADVEVIQGLIKKLADEVNAAEATATAPRHAPPPMPGPKLTEAAIESSLEVLRATADTMRDGAAPAMLPPALPSAGAARVEPTFAPPPVPAAVGQSGLGEMPPPLSDIAPWPAPISTSRPTQARINVLSEAIMAQRADVLLEPILGLDDQRPRHYEVLLRLRAASGQPLESESLIEELRHTGLLPILDCTRINRVANVARRLSDRGQTKAVFSEFSTESLADDKFLNDFANACHERETFAGQLVLTFTQAEIRALVPRDWSTLDDMRDLGFRFALQSITDLDMDFGNLRARGFEFVKLDADVFLQGLPASGGMIPAADICRHLAHLGLTLIVGAIDDESKLARIFGFGALFGQGQLFGGPRLVKPETEPARRMGAASHAAA